jgi:hypothetical protein
VLPEEVRAVHVATTLGAVRLVAVA